MSRPRKVLLAVALAAAAAAVAGGVLGWRLLEKIRQPYRGYPGQERIVLIPKGWTAAQIGQSLEEAGVIESAPLFRLYLKWDRDDDVLQAGEYRFDEPLTIPEVAEKLRSGAVLHRKITIREGLDLREIAERLAAAGFGRVEAFRAAAADPGPISDLDPLAEDLEGYLFPETYHFTRGADEQKIVATMVRHFRRVWTPERRRRAERMGWTVREVVTLASLIEKETGLAEERPLVSAVFHNRLKINMKLACDPTVVYAVKRIKEYDGVIHRSDLDLDSPYNTYLHPGLPPGPIANPGAAAIDAALHPAEADYLYFVSKNDGSHIFSRNYRDHQKAVAAYQR